MQFLSGKNLPNICRFFALLKIAPIIDAAKNDTGTLTGETFGYCWVDIKFFITKILEVVKILF